MYDINNDGLITYDEMLQIVQSIYDMTGKLFDSTAFQLHRGG